MTPARPERRSRARRATFWVGVSLSTTGVLVLGWFAWEYWGTNIVSHHKQQAQIHKLEAQWRAPTGPSAENGDVTVGSASALIRIPALGKDYVMPVLEGVSDDVLDQGFGHFTGTAVPGAIGNYALAAHRVTHGEPLRDMPDLRPGDTVQVETRTAVYTYVLDTDPNRLVVPFTADWVLDPSPVDPQPGGVGPPSEEHRLITLTTCSELFHTDNRMIAFGHLESVRSKRPHSINKPRSAS